MWDCMRISDEGQEADCHCYYTNDKLRRVQGFGMSKSLDLCSEINIDLRNTGQAPMRAEHSLAGR